MLSVARKNITAVVRRTAAVLNARFESGGKGDENENENENENGEATESSQLLELDALTRQFGPPCVASPRLEEVVGRVCTSPHVGIVRPAFLADGVRQEEGEQDQPTASRVVLDEYVFDAAADEYRLVLRDARSAHVEAGVEAEAEVQGKGPSQSTNEVLMVAPTAFRFNALAAEDNAFMNVEQEDATQSIRSQVLREYAKLYSELAESGLTIRLFQHGEKHNAPDSCFPNNWFSTHAASEANGGVGMSTLVYYPMKCENRRRERREDIKAVLEQAIGFDRVVDLSCVEGEGRYLEGTGALVLDRVNGVAYVALSERADAGLAERWVELLGYKDLVTFRSVDAHGSTVYHTNVMMAVGTSVAVVCLESVVDAEERRRLMERLSATHEIVEITFEQMGALCGNLLEVRDAAGRPVMAMSTRAYDAFSPEQRAAILKHVHAIHHAPVDMLEHVGGGGVRCTLAEIFR